MMLDDLVERVYRARMDWALSDVARRLSDLAQERGFPLDTSCRPGTHTIEHLEGLDMEPWIEFTRFGSAAEFVAIAAHVAPTPELYVTTAHGDAIHIGPEGWRIYDTQGLGDIQPYLETFLKPLRPIHTEATI